MAICDVLNFMLWSNSSHSNSVSRQAKLSAVLQFLHNIRLDKKEERRNLICDLCVSAYPDIQPWQVRKACLDPHWTSQESRIPCSDECMEDLYYSYLSRLLNPFDGHETARHDDDLVKEYCEWSVGIRPRPNKKPGRMENFLNIALQSSIQHKRYRRDLMVLLELSLMTGRDDLVLDLCKFSCAEPS